MPDVSVSVGSVHWNNIVCRKRSRAVPPHRHRLIRGIVLWVGKEFRRAIFRRLLVSCGNAKRFTSPGASVLSAGVLDRSNPGLSLKQPLLPSHRLR